MRKLIWTRPTLILIAGILCAGSVTDLRNSPPLSSVWADAPRVAAKPTVVLTKANNGKSAKVRVGGIFEVRLESNATTGYEWSVAVQNKAVLDSVGTPKFVAPEEGPNGAPGRQIFLFKTKKRGGTKLELHYVRPFEKGKPPIQTYMVHIYIE